MFPWFDVFRISTDQLTSEVNQLNKSLQKMESQLDNAADDVKDQLQDFLKVGKKLQEFMCVGDGVWGVCEST